MGTPKSVLSAQDTSKFVHVRAACRKGCWLLLDGKDCTLLTFDLPSVPEVAKWSRQAYFSPLLGAMSHHRVEEGREGGVKERERGSEATRNPTSRPIPFKFSLLKTFIAFQEFVAVS